MPARRALPWNGTTASAQHAVTALLDEAQRVGASDIHIEPAGAEVRIRLRIDGELVLYEPLPIARRAELTARIKILANLRTDEHQRPQDGRFRHELDPDAGIDVRVSTTPGYFGETVVLRLLIPLSGNNGLEELGFHTDHRLIIQRVLSQPHGLILTTGPTGSGKTSTLYVLLRLLARPSRAIATIEDPIEFAIPEITQLQTNDRVGLTFDSGLRSLLRQDPDVLMVGEMRDAETARIAVRAALTGHLVLSSLHTNDALSALPRLRDLTVDPYLLPATLRLIIAQRLVRRVCARCSVSRVFSHAEQNLIRAWSYPETLILPSEQRVGAGCSNCNHTGYRGRVGIFELLPMSDRMQEALHSSLPTDQLRRLVAQDGVRGIAHDGVRKLGQGITTLEEVARHVYD